jgi:hypothetical protein
MLNSSSINRNPLTSLVDFEQSVKEMTVGGKVEVTFRDANKYIELKYNGNSYYAPVDRSIIHQLGGRIWKDSNDYTYILKKWNESLNSEAKALEDNITSLFRGRDFIVKYYQQGSRKIVYGIVTKNFVSMNQIEFRERFLEISRKKAVLLPISEGITTTRYGAPIEYFGFDSKNSQVELKYGLIYAKNNGYDAYDVEWGRIVLVCSNGLKRWQGTKFKWKHTLEVELESFIDHIIDSGVGHQKHLNERIEVASSSDLDRSQVQELTSRMSLAEGSKRRIVTVHGTAGRAGNCLI